MRSFVSFLLISLGSVSLNPTAALLAADTPLVTSVVRDEPSLPPDVLTNEGIVQLSNAGFSDSFIVQKIQLSRTHLDTTVEGLTFLRHNSVSERLITYVLQHEAQPMPSAASPGAQAPPSGLVPMKIVKAKLLVPMNEPARSGHQASYFAFYPASQGSASTLSMQPAYALPAHPLLQSPVFPGAGAPVLTPAATQPSSLATR